MRTNTLNRRRFEQRLMRFVLWVAPLARWEGVRRKSERSWEGRGRQESKGGWEHGDPAREWERLRGRTGKGWLLRALRLGPLLSRRERERERERESEEAEVEAWKLGASGCHGETERERRRNGNGQRGNVELGVIVWNLVFIPRVCKGILVNLN